MWSVAPPLPAHSAWSMASLPPTMTLSSQWATGRATKHAADGVFNHQRHPLLVHEWRGDREIPFSRAPFEKQGWDLPHSQEGIEAIVCGQVKMIERLVHELNEKTSERE